MKFSLQFPLAVSMSSHPGCEDVTICAIMSSSNWTQTANNGARRKCKPSIHGYLKEAFPDKKKTFFLGIAQLGEGEGGESEPQIDFDTFCDTSCSNWCARGSLPKLILTLFLWYKLLKLVCKGEPSQIDFDTFSVKQVAQTGCWGEGGVTCAMP